MPRATDEQLTRVHTPEYISSLHSLLERARDQETRIPIDLDTTASPGTLEAVLKGSGAVCAAVDEVLTSGATRAFCVVRAPGHHAESDR